MTRLMADTAQVESISTIPRTTPIVAGYVDGWYRTFAPLVVAFPEALHVPIAVNAGTNDGLVLDVESGDATPGEAPAWCQMRREAGVHPTVYCSEAAWDGIRNSFRLTGVAEPEWWIAAYPGPGEQLYPGSVAHQYTDTGPYDLSVVADEWPGLDSPPGEEDMKGILVQAIDDEHDAVQVLNVGLGTVAWLPNGYGVAAAEFLAGLGLESSTIHKTMDKRQLQGFTRIGDKPPGW